MQKFHGGMPQTPVDAVYLRVMDLNTVAPITLIKPYFAPLSHFLDEALPGIFFISVMLIYHYTQSLSLSFECHG